ncbi:MAG: class I SAM-dependent methyltransferase [Pyrinomonadaceae bacterium]|jgi:16S rRNA (guanine527-N7)-methyltransferase|nr:class I SAM-dependent methyltransferase [Pyrinomonadaceae bacterium]
MVEQTILLPSDEFVRALESHAARYEVLLSARDQAGLRKYYEHLQAWNPRLHLVAPCSPKEFATRHVLESLVALHYLPHGATVCDVGSGGGLPIIPCLIVRPDLSATLIEASAKKAVFLRESLRHTGVHAQSQVVCARFELTPMPEALFVTCRALDRFTELFSTLAEWTAGASTLLLFGGHTLREQIEKAGLLYTAVHLPESGQRFLFCINRSAP